LNGLSAAISCDIDTLASIYKGQGCRRPGGYTYSEFSMGLENFSRFLQPFGIKSTLFMVGNDFKHKINHGAIQSMLSQSHEIANHTMTHAQGFRLLSLAEKETEIADMEDICESVTGQRPKGFRCPGWNIGDDALPILKRRGYWYDSSIHPTFLMPILKFLHWYSMSSRKGGERTTMGHLRYMFASAKPYRTNMQSLAAKGRDGIMEFPVTVTPLIRLPFFATFILATGFELFERSYQALKTFQFPIQFMFHLSDFVDYSHPDLANQVPDVRGVYVPQALRTSLEQKLILFRKVLDILAEDYTFSTLAEWSEKIRVSL
jgi:peptidoglycan-N-acetylglucosamine deacetylase